MIAGERRRFGRIISNFWLIKVLAKRPRGRAPHNSRKSSSKMNKNTDLGSPNDDLGPSAYNPSPPFKLGAGPGSGYGFRKDPIKKFGQTSESKKEPKPEFHSGQDFVAPAGTMIPNAASGVVVYSGFNKSLGNVVIVRNDRGDYSLYGHMQDGDRAPLGQRLGEGDTIGRVGGTGERSTGVHLHYSVLRPQFGEIIDSVPRTGGPIGIHLDGITTYDPIHPPPSYLDQTKRATEILSGLDGKSPLNGGSPPDRPGSPFFNPFNQATPAPAIAARTTAAPNPFADRFGKWGSVPSSNAPAASDEPTDFVDRFGNWDLRAPGALGNVGAPAPRVPDQGKRSEISNGGASDVAQATPSAWPFLAADVDGLGGVLKYFNALPAGTAADLSPADQNAPDFSPPPITNGDTASGPRLVGRVVNLSAPPTGAPPLSSDWPDAVNGTGSPPPTAIVPTSSVATAPAASSPRLGIFSGKPMPNWSVPPPIFQPKDQSSSDDNELYRRWMRWLDA
jgi:murein DD-endopeptidase MepM/ murein hydrolase activator NlpD